MTSNVGSPFIREFAESGDKEALDGAINEALRVAFRPEFLNRVDDIVIFNSLTAEATEKIVELQLKEVTERLAESHIELEITPAALEHLSLDGFDPVYGARPLKRLIQKVVVDRVAQEIVQGNLHDGQKVIIDLDTIGEYKSTVE